MLFSSNTCLAPLFTASCRMASKRCCSSTLVVRWIRASSTASFSILLAFSFSTRSVVWIGMPISSSLTRCSSSVFTDCRFTFSLWNRSMTGPSLFLSIPSSRCSGPTERLARRAASSREKARISDTLGENWLVILLSNSFLLLVSHCKDTTFLANIVPFFNFIFFQKNCSFSFCCQKENRTKRKSTKTS